MTQAPPTTSKPSASQSTQSVPDICLSAWRPPLRDSRELLYFPINHPLREPPPTSQLSSRSGSMSLTTLGLRSRSRSKICDGESFRGHRGSIRDTGLRCGITGIPLLIKPSSNRIRGTRLKDMEDGEFGSTHNLIERFSRNKYLEELHKHEKGEKKGEYVDFCSTRFWEKFHKVQMKAEENVEAEYCYAQ
ncbi:hypothetical protein M9H77_12080 [Catharanthus roseus]|uniref:Uncharacterized protein n=1 Tax=Catharanthus roseus TaxID=4058 RepID=A0ACC0BGB8_CATRO|nr:hypothetical protein M9H77_12080 [Catharanthus roseus]